MKPAITAGSGECFWELDAAKELVERAVQSRLGVIGCEIYRRHEVGWGTFVDYWDVDPPRGANECWSAFVRRCGEFNLIRLSAEPRPDGDRDGNGRLYFVAVAEETHYGRLVMIDPLWDATRQVPRVGRHPAGAVAGSLGTVRKDVDWLARGRRRRLGSRPARRRGHTPGWLRRRDNTRWR
jgi:hypothetical protein